MKLTLTAAALAVALLTAIPAQAATVDATWNSPNDVALIAESYNATGNSIELTLNFAPVTGTSLTVIRNTGLEFINGTFGNLEQGQTVSLSFGTAIYRYVANYYGGSGNDLVLNWAAARPTAWGANSYGQLGDNSTTSRSVAVAVSQSGVLEGKVVTSVAVGGEHSLALCSDGTLVAWGRNTYGQLGNSSNLNSKVPVAVLQTSGALAGKAVVAISAGYDFSLALCSDGTVAAWGNTGVFGGKNVPASLPEGVGVLAGRTVVAISAGDRHSLALCSDGTLAAWGSNLSRQLGDGNLFSSTNVPVAVQQNIGALAGKTVIAISAGKSHSVALCSDGTVACWGGNSQGQLGNDGLADSGIPVAVKQSAGLLAGKSVVAVAAGASHTLALCADGTLAAWGSNSLGQLGNNSTTNSNLPVAVQQDGILSGKTIATIAAGFSHSVAMCTDGILVAWGDNAAGQLGNTTTSQSIVPSMVDNSPLEGGQKFARAFGNSAGNHTFAFVASPPPSEITVTSNGIDIGDGDTTPNSSDSTNFGSVATASGEAVRTYIISNSGPSNSGTTPLTLTDVTVSGPNAADFTVTYQPAAHVDIGSATSFVVAFDPSANGLRSATLSFTYNGGRSFSFSIQGTGLNMAPSAISLTSASIAENKPPGAVVGTLFATDYDLGDAHSFSLVSGPGGLDNPRFTITGNTLTLNDSADFEAKNSYAIRVGVNDGQGGLLETNFTITITDELEAPVVTSPTATAITATTAILGAEIAFDGGASITECGIVYSETLINAEPRLEGPGVTKVTSERAIGAFTAAASSLSPTTAYSFRAYATNAYGTSYSDLGDFGTPITFTYAHATEVPVRADRYAASGSTVALGLAFAPETGTSLTVVENTGTDFITGTFSNLAPGQTVELSFGRVTYQFVANYHGGTGNDLVLQWAGAAPMAWGKNSDGQLGNDSTTQHNSPVAVVKSVTLTGKTVIAVAAGGSHSLALSSDGTVAAWGRNSEGQLGISGTTSPKPLPVSVWRNTGPLSGRHVVAVAAGDNHSLALCSDGTLAVWGANASGQLGNAINSPAASPTTMLQAGVLLGKRVVAVAAGSKHSLALCSDGTVAAWGDNQYGQLGNNSTTQSNVPVLTVQTTGPLAGKKVIAICAGASHSLALCSDGTMASWGWNTSGQLGNSSTVDSKVPVAVSQSEGVLAGKTVIAISAGGSRSLALCSDGSVAGWGGASAVPESQSGGALVGKTVIKIASGMSHSLALCSDGTLAAWGNNSNGQLGIGSSTGKSLPEALSATALGSGERFIGLGAGSCASHTLALIAAPASLEVSLTGNGVNIANGDSVPRPSNFTDFGSVATTGGSVVRTFSIGNTGPTALTLGSVTIQGHAAADFTVTAQPMTSVDLGGSTTFDVTFNPGANGMRSAVLSFSYSDDPDLPPFTLSIQGTGLNTAPTAIALSSTSIVENNAPDALVGTLSATDVDIGDLPTFSLVAGTGATDNASFSIEGTGLKLRHSADFESKSSYAIRIGVDDGQGGTFQLPFIITILNAVEPPSVTAPSVAGATSDSADLRGNVVFNGGMAILERGVVYSVTSVNDDPSVGGAGVMKAAVDGGAGFMAVVVTDLSPNTLYSFKAYATNAQGTGYSSVGTFTTGISFTYTAPGDVPLTDSSYTASGSINLALGHMPEIGANLMLVNNTGGDFIKGAFSNLAHGETVALNFGGVTYRFVANYYGGSGNDIVLHWDNVRLLAWGRNNFGQLGDGGLTDRTMPVAVDDSGVLNGKTILAVAGGQYHSLALCSDGTLAAWGANSSGQLGNGSFIPSEVPVAVQQSSGALFGRTVIAIAVGGAHSLAVCSDGSVVRWGSGIGNVPVAVTQNSGALVGKKVIAVAAGNNHSLALCSDGTVVAWGSNADGQLGIGTGDAVTVPKAVVQDTGVLAGRKVVKIAAGNNHSLALCSDGTIASWGRNISGQLGNNSLSSSIVPVPVSQNNGVLFGKTAVSIAAGDSHSLAVCSDGTMAAWGGNSYGQLGDNSSTNSKVPVAVVQDSGPLSGKMITSVAAGRYHTLARCSDGTLAAWGWNDHGQLGNSSTTNSNTPVAVNSNLLDPRERFIHVGIGSMSFQVIALVASPPPSEITVTGNNVDIAYNDATPSSTDFTDFGTVALAGAQATRAFIVRNSGDAPLNLKGTPRVQFTGPAAADFKLTRLPASPIAVDASTDFAITFDPSLPGLRRADVLISSDDPRKGAFRFAIQGFGELSKPLAQTIAFTAPATVYLGQGPLQLSASATSGLPVMFSVLSGPATLSGSVLTLTGTGTVKIQATQPGGGNYAAARAVTLSIAIKANPTALTLTGLNQMYNGMPRAIGTQGGAGEVVITYTVNGVPTTTPPTNAGAYTVKAVAGKVIKTGKLVITKAPLIVTPDDKHKFAGQANPALTATYSGFLGSDSEAVMTKLPVLSTTARPTSPGGQYPITAKGGMAANYIFIYRQGTFMVESFAGGYEALLTNAGGLPVGKLVLTVPLAGQTFTGKLYTSEETASMPLKGSLTTIVENGEATGLASATVKGVAYAVNFTLPLYGDVHVTATRDSAPLGSALDGRKLLSLPRGGKVSYAGAHTVVLEPATPVGATVPAGAGWATASISTAGVITLAGEFADGRTFTTSLAPDLDGDPGYRMFVQPYLPARTQSHMAGQFRLKAHPNAALAGRRYLEAEDMTWSKAGRSADASYRSGFGPVTTVLTLDPWQKPTAKVPLNTLLGIDDAGIAVTHTATGSVAHDDSLPTSLSLSPANVVKVLVPAANITKWKATLTPATGKFSGSFELRDGAPVVRRTVPFTGVLRQPPVTPAASGVIIGDGHYLLPPLSGTEKSSGGVSFTRP